MAQRHQALNCIVLGLVVSLQLFIIPSVSRAASPDKIRQEIQQIIDNLQQSHGLKLSWEGIGQYKGPELQFEEISARELPQFLSFLRVLKKEIGLYPADFFKPSGLNQIVFAKKLFNGSEPAHGIYRLPRGVMYFDIYRNFRNRQVQRHGIHHEIFHVVSSSMWIDPVMLPGGWDSLNEPGFQYKKEGWDQGVKNSINSMAPQLGFATEYGTSTMEEDRAEIFACLMLPEQRRLIEEWGKKDEVLRKKIIAMKTIIQSYSPPMDAAFWGASDPK